MSAIDRTDLHRLVDDLPEESLSEVALFLEFVHYRVAATSNTAPSYTPVALGGLWQGVTITEDDIAAVRQEMWHGFGEATE